MSEQEQILFLKDHIKRLGDIIETTSHKYIENKRQLATVTAERDQALAELKLWKPMTPEEAEAAFDEAVPMPIPDEKIAEMVARITDPSYRPTQPERVLMAARIQQLDDLISHIWIHADMAYTINQMTTEQRELYDAIVDRQLKKAGI